MNEDKRKVALATSVDPDTNMSYGILMDYLAQSTQKKYRWNIIAEGYDYGKPVVHDYYTKWNSGKDIYERDSKMLPSIAATIKPDFMFSLGDVQHYSNTKWFKPLNLPWIHWLPVDNHDLGHLRKVQYVIEGMDICVAMSRFGYDFCVSNGVKMDHWVYPFVPTNKFYKVNEHDHPKEFAKIKDFKEGTGLNDKKVLLFVGRPGWRKNLEFTFGLLNVLLKERGRDDVVLYMHTDPDDPASKMNIGKLLHAFRIPQNSFYMTRQFNWATGVKLNFINALYNVAYCYIGTHGGEGFGMPFAEAMSAKCPFVATNCTTMPELAGENGERGLLARTSEVHDDQGVQRPYVDIDHMADQVEKLLDDEKLRNKMGRAGRNWVVRNCDTPVVARKWEKIFDSVAVSKANVLGVE